MPEIDNKQLADEQQQFETFFALALDLWCIADADGRFIKLNPMWSQTLGYSLEELEGRSFLDFIHADDLQATLNAMSILDTQNPLWNFINRYRCKDGSYVSLEWRCQPRGRLYYAAARDITERLRREADLGQLAAIVSSSNDAIISETLDGSITSWNDGAERIFGYQRDEAIQKPITILIPPELHDEETIFLQKILSGETVKNYDTIRLKKDGGRVFVSVSLSPIKNTEDKIVGASKIAHDITERQRSEEGLARLAAIVTSSHDAIFSTTLDGIITSWNAAAEKILGYSADEAMNKSFTMLMYPENVEKERNLLRKIANGEVVQNYDSIRLKKNGSEIFVSVTLSPIINGKGRIVGVSRSVQDVTERKQKEDQLRQSEAALKQAQRIARMGSWMWNVQSNRFEMSDEVFEICGIKRENFNGDLNTLIRTVIHPDDRTTLLQAENPTSRNINPLPREYRIVRPDGVVKTVWSETGEMVFDAEGKPTFLTGIVQDITERKHSEEALRRYAERLAAINRLDRIISSNLDIGEVYDNFVKELQSLIRLDRTAIVRLNEERDRWQITRQWTSHEPVFVPGEWHPLNGSIIEWLMENRLPYSEPEVGEDGNWPETEVLKREGIRSRVLLPLIINQQLMGVLTVASRRLAAFSDEDQSILMTIADQLSIAIQNSILYQKIQHHAVELEQRVIERTKQLEASNKELEAFSYSVSHDLRSPLRAIDGFSRILLRDYAAQLPASAARYLNLVRDNSQQMGTLIDDLLTFSRLNGQPLNKQTVDLISMVRRVLQELLGEPDNRQIEIKIGDLPTCTADPALLKLVVVNLISNALKFTQQRDLAYIEVGYQTSNEGNVYYVKDNGAGFDMAYSDKLFGVFQRLHRAEDYPGTGVGLATVQRIIHRHGGRIWAEAEVDKGATFYFVLEGEQSHD